MPRAPHALFVAVAIVSSTAAVAAAQSVDLLHAVPTDVAVSSVYRGQGAQTPRLVDGELATAWNSRSGDLTGAWIEVRLPAAATVTSIEMTAGFTGPGAVFDGNYRVTRVRVSRDGAALGEHALDPSSRELQTIPVSGPGGVYRIEVVQVAPGSRRQWREICISELRVMGSAPGAQPGQRFPRWAVGALPTARGAVTRDEVRRRFQAAVAELETSWRRYDDRWMGLEYDTGIDGPSSEDLVFFSQTRRTAHLQAAEVLDPIDGVRADALRRVMVPAYQYRSYSAGDAEDPDLDRLAAAYAAAVEWLGDADSRCRWATAHARLRLQRLWSRAEVDRMMWESQGPGDPYVDRSGRRGEITGRRVHPILEAWRQSPARALPALLRLTVPRGYAARHFELLQTEARAMQTHCGG
ncbi:MAG: discoidin domain-containing protein [Sandaracinaceae bacterium]|nr:discoidin domain-containing protein [Sandaracinaceae bacterium]